MYAVHLCSNVILIVCWQSLARCCELQSTRFFSFWLNQQCKNVFIFTLHKTLLCCSSVVRIWFEVGTKLGGNNLRVTQKYYVILYHTVVGELMSQKLQKALYWFFYWMGNYMESNVRVCVAVK